LNTLAKALLFYASLKLNPSDSNPQQKKNIVKLTIVRDTRNTADWLLHFLLPILNSHIMSIHVGKSWYIS